MTFPRVVLFLSAAVFAFFGAWGFVAPEKLVALVDVGVPSATARADVRAQYGGFMLGLGAFLFACLYRPRWTMPGLAASAFTLTGFALARAISVITSDPDGMPAAVIYYLMAAEAAGAVLSFVGWHVAAREVNRVPQ
jgi:hypothetical protein